MTILSVPKVGQMFNALGLGFSFVLSFLILPGEGDETPDADESKNGTDCSNSSLTLDDLSPVGCPPSVTVSLFLFVFLPHHAAFPSCLKPTF